MKLKCSIGTPLGEMEALLEGGSLCGLRFVGQKYASLDDGAWKQEPDHPLFVRLRSQLEDYFAGQAPAFDLPLAPKGTAFQMVVWSLLRAIPSGMTTTYGALARLVAVQREGRIPSAQAVGGAVGHNPIAIIIPCHRVIGADGSLIGYAAGLERKVALLTLENVEYRA